MNPSGSPGPGTQSLLTQLRVLSDTYDSWIKDEIRVPISGIDGCPCSRWAEGRAEVAPAELLPSSGCLELQVVLAQVLNRLPSAQPFKDVRAESSEQPLCSGAPRRSEKANAFLQAAR